MPNFIEKIKQLFSNELVSLSLEKVGIKSISDERFVKRQIVLSLIHEKLHSNEYTTNPIKRIELLDNYISVFTAPYGRPMENSNVARMLIAWEQLKAWYFSLFELAKENPSEYEYQSLISDIEVIPDTEGFNLLELRKDIYEKRKRATYIDILDKIALEDIIPLGMMIVKVLYSMIDVTPSHVVVANIPPEVAGPPEEEISEDSDLFKVYEERFKEKKEKKSRP